MCEFGRRAGGLVTSGMLLVSVVSGAVALGCSSKDHAPFIAPSADGGRQGATNGAGTGGDTGSTSDAGTGALSGGQGEVVQMGDPPFPSGPFDPNETYLVATLRNPLSPMGIIPLSHLDTYVFGLNYQAYHPQFRGAEIDYLPVSYVPIRAVTPDLDDAPPPADFVYPNTIDNDAIIPTPACSKGPKDFVAGPGGNYVYQCDEAGPWFSGDEQIFPGPGYIIALSTGQLALTYLDEEYNLLDLSTGKLTPVPGLLNKPRAAARGIVNGFLVINDNTIPPSLIEVRADGSTANLGAFNELNDLYQRSSVLTGNGDYIVFGFLGPTDDTILIERMTLKAGTKEIARIANADSYFEPNHAVLITGH